MTRGALALLVLLTACRKHEQVAPAPETKPSASAAPAEVHSVEAMSCRDGVFGTPLPPAPSASAAIDSGVGGLGLSGIGGFGHGVGYGGVQMHHPIVAAPIDAGDARALAIARVSCGAHREFKRCHNESLNPTGSITFELAVDNGKATATRTDGLDDANLTDCLQKVFATRAYQGSGKLAYRISFEPGRKAGSNEGLAVVAGRLPPEVIQRVLRAHSSKARHCYQTALASQPTLTGSLKLELVIGTTGDVTSAKITDGSITDATMRACLVGVYKAVVFPAPDGGEVKVAFPLQFTSAG